jgi:Tfp pilus assembly protein PilP
VQPTSHATAIYTASRSRCAGTSQAERSNAVAVGTTDHLTKPHALDVLLDCSSCQHYLRNRVYEYWKEKRKTTAKPSLRRLQAPTPESEPNPYLVFRQRAKPNKPLTRRRRETQDESIEKMAAIVENLDHALKLAGILKEREGQKMCLTVRAAARRMHAHRYWAGKHAEIMLIWARETAGLYDLAAV